MASGAIGDSSNELNWRGRCRWTENSKVYTRKLHKKVQNTSNNTTTSAAENPPPRPPAPPPPPPPSENPTTTPAPTKVSSSTVASATTTEVSTASTSKDPKDSAAASPPPTTPASHSVTTATPGNAGDNAAQESQEAIVTKDAVSCQQRPQLGDQLLHQQHMPSLSEDNYSAEHGVQEGSGSQNAELHNYEDLLPPQSSEALKLKRPSPLPGPNETLQQGGDGPQCLRESSPLISENVLPNVREVAAPQFPIGNVLQSDEDMMPLPPQVPSGNGPASINGVNEPLIFSKVDDKISNSNLSNTSNYIGVESVDGGNIGGHSYPQPEHARNDLVDRRVLLRVSSEGGVAGQPEVRPMGLARVNSDVGTTRNLEPRPYSRQLSVAVMENNRRAGEFVEKEKRTPKANQYYRNSEFLLGKDRLPSESVKRLKTNNGRKHSGETEHAFRLGFGFDKSRNQVFKSCSSLLQRLMKHKHGWVFNEPVDAKALGLVDYHDIIKHPMDLGTIKTRLSQNWYKSPREFAEDVRLVFRNAMTYNPKGQDVHIMAEQLSQIFEERWAIIETSIILIGSTKCIRMQVCPLPLPERVSLSLIFAPASVPALAPAPVRGSAPAAAQDHAYAPTSAAPIHLHAPAAPQMRTLDRPETLTIPMAVDPRVQRTHVGRTPLPKKPKAKDPNKRDMTYEEKQRLSTNLQGLPSEKLDAIVQIIKKRNTALSQHDDEIEVDIDNVDAETLWELDRFVTNYKKSLSKNKRKAELALQARLVANQTVAPTNKMTAVADVRSKGGTVLRKALHLPAVEGEKQGIPEVGPAVQAVPAVILDLRQVIPIAIVPLEMDQMQGIHLGHEWIYLRYRRDRSALF
ncbi:UNVERIFIED_CONTAM: Transcription factor GTE4 [Sesamum radiatum]|uniref:Transcription factor GTE4 n=1 Tax=Sesamum radiatum TaxID=300843 RepID=A0AAW2KJB8_SESRA